MEVKDSMRVEAEVVEGIPGVTVRWLWSVSDGAPTFALRLFEVQPGAVTPYHSHAHEHEVYVLSGHGILRGKSQQQALQPDDTVLILPHELHQFINSGSDTLRFLCGIPLPEEPLGLTAQVNLHSLGKAELATEIEEALETFQQYDLEVTPGSAGSLVSGNSATIFKALKKAFHKAAEVGEIQMVTTLSNASFPAAMPESERRSFQAIGYVANEFNDPTASSTLRASVSRIIVRTDLSEGLTGLAPGDKVLVVFYFHRSEEYELLQHPRGNKDRPKRGVFALRSPRRPNPIGITEVELLKVEENILTVRGLDALNETPVLDLKPA